MQAIRIYLDDTTFWELPPQPQKRIEVHEPSIEACSDVDRCVAAALQQPIDFVPFDQAVVAGDRLVLAVDVSIPQIDRLLVAIINWFAAHGTASHHIRVVLAGADRQRGMVLRERLAEQLQQQVGTAVELELHRVDDPAQVAYVGADKQAAPIYLNRSMVDADVVIPITVPRPADGIDSYGNFTLFPLVSDQRTRQQFSKLSLQAADPAQRAKRERSDEAAQWGGIHLAIQVIPARHGRIATVFAGSLARTAPQALETLSAAWTARLRPGDLTISTLETPADQQDWTALARALHVASRCTIEGGAIVVCSRAAPRLGAAGRRWRAARLQLAAEAPAAALVDDHDDAVAMQLLETLVNDKQVYLVSELDDELVASLGMTPLHSVEEIASLVDQAARTILLPCAPYWQTVIRDDEP